MGWFSGAGNGTETGHTMNVRISLSDGPACAPRSSMNDTSFSGAPMPYTTRSPALGMAIRSRRPESTSSRSSRSANGPSAPSPFRATRRPRHQQIGPSADRASTRPMPGCSERRMAPAARRAPVDHPGTAAQYGSRHVLERRASGNLGEGAGECLSVIGQDVEVIAELGQALDYLRELADRVVDVMESSHGRPMGRTEGMGEDVVVEEVDIDGRHAPVQIGRDAEREHLAHPDREHDLEPEPPEAVGPRGARSCRHARDEAGQLDGTQAEALHHHPAEQSDRESQTQHREPGA